METIISTKSIANISITTITIRENKSIKLIRDNIVKIIKITLITIT